MTTLERKQFHHCGAISAMLPLAVNQRLYQVPTTNKLGGDRAPLSVGMSSLGFLLWVCIIMATFSFLVLSSRNGEKAVRSSLGTPCSYCFSGTYFSIAVDGVVNLPAT